jgi:anti-sigma factor RsiW
VTCTQLRNLLHGFVDGELDLVRHLEIDHHLQECSACSEAVSQRRALRKALGDAALYHRPPLALRERIQSCLRQASKPPAALPVLPRRWLGVAAALAFVALLVWGIVRIRSLPTAEELLAQEVASSHVRSLLLDKLLDVASSDQHSVKPWFQGKLDFAPAVKNLAGEGYPLIGGRLEYLDNRKVAAVVYKRDQHVINLFIWPATTEADEAPRALTRQGYLLLHWTRAGLTFWVISDLNQEELQEFVGLIQR